MIASVRPRLSLCMIVRNEERNLAQCLDSVRSAVDEMVIVDTGSTDHTREIAHSYGATVVLFPWVDDFSAARNESMRQATGDYLLWLDADDRLLPADTAKLQARSRSLDGNRRAVVMRTICEQPPTAEGPTIETHPRLFRADPELRWQYRVHEQIMPALERLNYEIEWADVTIQHLGYADESVARLKANRNLRLCRLDYAVNPHDACILYHLGKECARVGHYAEALGYLLKSLREVTAAADWVGKVYADTVAVLSALRRTDEALALAAEGIERCGSNPQLLIESAELLAADCRYEESRKMLLRMMEIPHEEHFDSGITADGFRRRAHRMLSAIDVCTGRFAEAESVARLLLEENSVDPQTWFMLAYIQTSQQRWPQVDEAVAHLRALPGGEPLACCAQAEACKCRGDLAGAQRHVERAIELQPNLLLPRTLLADLLLASGASLDACRAALGEILRLAPGNMPAKRTLEALEARQSARDPNLCCSVTVGPHCPIAGTSELQA